MTSNILQIVARKSVFGPIVFAQAAKRLEDLDLTDTLIRVGVIIGALLLLALVVWFMRGWYARRDREDVSASSLLTEFRELEEEGELTTEEFKKIKARLASQIRAPIAKKKGGGDPAKRDPSGDV